MIDLKAKPFNLKDEDIKWVKETLAGMKLEEKVGQLFCLISPQEDISNLVKTLEEINLRPGGIMSRPFSGKKVQENYRHFQENSKIPLLLAANLEKGGEGIALDGTVFGNPMEVAATDDETMAYKLGLVCGREGKAVGCNWAFAPVIDIDYNFNNPITNTRTYGSDPERVLRMAKEYMKGIQESGLAVSIKHWPGDGVDSRDQHLVTSVNTMTVEKWNETYGKVYKGMIDAGANTVMAAHIMLPEYSKKLMPGILDKDIMPASLSYELNQTLLRDRLGFNGLIITDSTAMSGFMIAMSRELAVPSCIAAGCDMLLFTNNLKEDYEYMLKGVESGIITKERLEGAVTRILALKSSLNLHRQKVEGTLVAEKNQLEILNCEEHKEWARECADKAITLVKDTQNILPLSINKNKRILLYVLGDEGGFYDESKGFNVKFIELMEKEGFEITKAHISNLTMEDISGPIQQFKQKYDLILYFASVRTASNQTVVRLNWAQPMGADVPKFIMDIPTVFISIDNPYHLQDVPRIKTFINGYSSSEYVVEAIVKKLLGKSEFKGINPIDPFCGYWDAKL